MNIAPVSEAWLQPPRGQRVLLKGPCNLGRAADNDVVLEGSKASRHHAVIHMQASEEYWLADLNSANGTFCNGRRVIRPVRLHDGDRITAADVTFIFRQLRVDTAARSAASLGDTIPVFTEEPAWLLMADLQGHTELSHRVGARELVELLRGWMRQCEEAVTKHHGQVGKYLGDGLLAYWRDGKAEDVTAALWALEELRRGGAPPFRVVLHYGLVTFGGASALGEEAMRGADVNFIFRLERAASTLGLAACTSAAAQERLGPLVPTAPFADEHDVVGFPGKHRIHEITWPKRSRAIEQLPCPSAPTSEECRAMDNTPESDPLAGAKSSFASEIGGGGGTLPLPRASSSSSSRSSSSSSSSRSSEGTR